jgi:AcrR family transcriptional regulator
VRSRNALTGALLELLEEKPFDQLTIREISARAGTGYATFFRHYPTKEALLSDVASEEIADLLQRAIPILYDSNSYESTLALCRHVAEHRNLWAALLTGGAAGILREEFIRQARELPREFAVVKSWLPADLGVVYGTGGTIDLLAWWLSQEDEYTPEQIAGILNRLIIAPLVGDRGVTPAHAG